MRPSLLNALRFFAFASATALLTACGGHGGTIPATPGGASPLSTGITSSASSLLAPPAPAIAPTIKEWPITTGGSGPVGITTGPDGALWFTEYNMDQIGRMTTAGVNTNEFPDGSPGSSPNGIALGPDSRLWFTEYNTNQIGAMTTAGTVHQYGGLTASSTPAFIVAGSDNNMWFTEFNSGLGTGRIGRITVTGKLNEYTDGVGPWDITSVPGGDLWFAEVTSSTIGRMTTNGILTNQYKTVQAQSLPYNIAYNPVVGPIGDGNIWFTVCGSFAASPVLDQIGRVTLKTGQVNEWPVPTQGSCPNGITAGPDGNMWFVENGFTGNVGGSAIGKITMPTTPTTTPTINEYPLSNPIAGPMMITKGPDGNLWFTENTANKIGEIVFPSASGSGSGSGCKNDKPTGDTDAKHGDNNQDGKNGDKNNNQQCGNH